MTIALILSSYSCTVLVVGELGQGRQKVECIALTPYLGRQVGHADISLIEAPALALVIPIQVRGYLNSVPNVDAFTPIVIYIDTIR